MTVHGSTCTELAGTVGASEPQSLWCILDWKPILASWSHKAGNKPAGRPSNIPWPAGDKVVSPYRPQVRREHQNRSGRRVVSVNPDFQIDQSETQTKTLQIYLAAQRG